MSILCFLCFAALDDVPFVVSKKFYEMPREVKVFFEGEAEMILIVLSSGEDHFFLLLFFPSSLFFSPLAFLPD